MLNLCEDRYSLGIGVVVMNSAVKVLTACGQAGDVNYVIISTVIYTNEDVAMVG